VARIQWRGKTRRAGLLLAALVLLFAVFGVNALVAWAWPEERLWVLALIAFDIGAFVAIFVIFHSALDPPNRK